MFEANLQSHRRIQQLDCGGRVLDLSKPQVMAVLNVTPDSFSDGGRFSSGDRVDLDKVLMSVEQFLVDGAAIIDVGGESTRPGAESVPLQLEMDRVLPVVEAISERFETIISVDTSSPKVMTEASLLGAGLLNDVRALERPGALEAAARTGLPVCLMHMQGSPKIMQNNPHYHHVVTDVMSYLSERVDRCVSEGINRNKLLLDPGFGFGKSVEHNLQLLKHLPDLLQLGFPLLVGLSRKSLIAKVLGRDIDQRLAGSLGLAVMSLVGGATIIRAHDVAETVDAARLYYAIECSDAIKTLQF